MGWFCFQSVQIRLNFHVHWIRPASELSSSTNARTATMTINKNFTWPSALHSTWLLRWSRDSAHTSVGFFWSLSFYLTRPCSMTFIKQRVCHVPREWVGNWVHGWMNDWKAGWIEGSIKTTSTVPNNLLGAQVLSNSTVSTGRCTAFRNHVTAFV